MQALVQTPRESPEPAALRELVPCPLCGAKAFTPATGWIPDGECHSLVEPWKSMTFQMVRCSSCGLVYQHDRPRREHIGAFYSSEYDCYESLVRRGPIVRTLAQLTARKLVRRIDALRPKESDVFLDFGCGSGSWLELLASVGAPWRMVGTEISADLVEKVKAQGFEAHVADDSNIEQHLPAGSLSVVHMHHVIEHVQDPLGLLRSLRALLVPGGLVVGQTPDSSCLECRIFGDNWLQWHLPRHLAIFDKPTLARLAEQAGLEVVALESSPSGAVAWGGSLLKAWAKRRGRPYLVTREPLHPVLMLLFAPVAVVQAKLASTSHMDFILRRPR
jgi:2-polyprenyl-3-methyl-5-hydroxy-6-metoxy-1,4-benzoquinol methylase